MDPEDAIAVCHLADAAATAALGRRLAARLLEASGLIAPSPASPGVPLPADAALPASTTPAPPLLVSAPQARPDLQAPLASRRPPGCPLLLLRGPLGAGKTCLVQGLALGLGIDEPITSPTFALAHHYRGQRGAMPTALVHLDLYRLEQPAAADELFAQEEEEAQALGALLAVEWPERLSFVPQPCWCLQLELAGEGRLARLWGHTINPTAG